jgi:hypothetical protein
MPAGPSTKEAAQVLYKLLGSRKLPDTEDAQPNLSAHIDPFSTNYPMSRRFSLNMKSSSFKNHYIMSKESAESTWTLQKAWRTDAQGNIVKEYALP